jgi:hypothetical protein
MTADDIRKGLIANAAAQLGVEADALYNLIKFETANTFDPQIANPYSSAKGLIQFTDSTAQGLGFSDSQDLITKLPDFSSQLEKAVVPYLAKYRPFTSRQSLYMAVFYPAARNWSPDTLFSSAVQAVNPGIQTVQDYINKVEQGKGKGIALVALALVSAAIFILLKMKG